LKFWVRSILGKMIGGMKLCNEKKKPSLKSVFSNWKSNRASFFSKVKMAVRNNLIKIKKKDNCCGHYGEVGC